MENTKVASTPKFVGSTYHGLLDFSSLGREMYQDEYGEDKVIKTSASINEEYEKALTNICKREFEDSGYNTMLQKYGIRVKDVSFWTPKSYNYTSDKAVLELEYNIEELLEAVKGELKHKIKVYLDQEKRDSGPGYISSEPRSYEELVRKLDPEQEIRMGDPVTFPAIVRAIELKEDPTKIENVKQMVQDKACDRYVNLLKAELDS